MQEGLYTANAFTIALQRPNPFKALRTWGWLNLRRSSGWVWLSDRGHLEPRVTDVTTVPEYPPDRDEV